MQTFSLVYSKIASFLTADKGGGLRNCFFIIIIIINHLAKIHAKPSKTNFFQTNFPKSLATVHKRHIGHTRHLGYPGHLGHLGHARQIEHFQVHQPTRQNSSKPILSF